MSADESVVYVLPDKMGGMMTIVGNLLAHRRTDGFQHGVILTHNRRDRDARAAQSLAADFQGRIDFDLPTENLRAVMKRLANAVPPGGGVYVAGDLLDLATASIYDFGRAVVHVLHGDTEYYYDLAVRHDTIVHAFVTYSRRTFDELRCRLPHRADAIFYLPYGVEVPAFTRRPAEGPLRVVFAGRFDDSQKGIFDLPLIDRVLRDRGTHVRWTVAGAGPDGTELRQRWSFNPDVVWAGCLASRELLGLYRDQDVFVLPTRHEGFPVALLESMSVGLVPVVSDIASGVPEVVTERTGIRVEVRDIPGFATALQRLDSDRSTLEGMSSAARHAVECRFDIKDRVADYQALYARWRQLYRRVAGSRHLQYGSRLDRPWMPNALVRFVRSARSAASSR